MSVLPVGFGGGSTAYGIDYAVRFRGTASAYFSKILKPPTDGRKYTIAGYIKLGGIGSGTSRYIMSTLGGTYEGLAIDGTTSGARTADTLTFFFNGGTAVGTSALLRDSSAHYPFVLAVDTTQATSANRVKIYLPGLGGNYTTTPLTNHGSSSYPTQNALTGMNAAVLAAIGRFEYSTNQYYDGLVSDFYFIDGLALDPTYFGELNNDNVWVPKQYAGLYGANGFHLDFSDPSSTSTLGYDSTEYQLVNTRGEGTVGGDMTYYTNNGVVCNARAFDGFYNRAHPDCAAVLATSGYVSKSWSTAKTIVGYKVHAPNNYDFGGSTNTVVTFYLEGSNNGSSWTTLHTSPALTTNSNDVYGFLSGIDTTQAYLYHRVRQTKSGGNSYFAQVVMYEKKASIVNTNGYGVYFDGSNDYLELSANAAWSYGTGDFTVEGTFRFLESPGDEYLLGRYSTGGPYGCLQVQNTSIAWYYGNGTSHSVTIPAGSFTQGEDYHIAVTRDSSDELRIFVNGYQIGSSLTSHSTDYSGSDVFRIDNGSTGGGHYCKMVVSNVRVVKGTAVYTANFEPPTGPLTAVTNTVLLACQTSDITKDNSTNNFTITNNGGALSTRQSYVNLVNDWVLSSGISTTAGVTYDVLTDTPTNNYATINPLRKNSVSWTVSEANLRVYSGSASNNPGAVSSLAMRTGKWYWEVTVAAIGSGAPSIGIQKSTYGLENDGTNAGYTSADTYHYIKTGNKQNGASGSAYGATYTTANVIGVAFDADAGTLEFFKDNTSQGTAFTGIGVADWTAWASPYNGGDFQFNFGQRPFAYTLPSGFKSLCTANLPAVAIKNPKQHFDVTTWVSNQTDGKTVTGLQFQPDLFWAKERVTGRSHNIFDAVRGVTKSLRSDGTDAEQTIAVSATGKLKSFNSDGYTFGADTDSSYGSVNYGTTNHVGWNWKANGAGSSNTDGTITSTVSANQTAGFSIVTYTGTGANATVGHGLGVAPKMHVVKRRDAGAQDWVVWHDGLTADTKAVFFNSAGAEATDSTYWNSLAPTSSVINLGSNANTNNSAWTYVAYCFAEIPGYSKFGTYIGNGSTDGPFVYCGFRPRFLMVKCLSAIGTGWVMLDTARDTYNKANQYVSAESSGAEGTSNMDLDIVSNGFKLRMGNSSINQSLSYIFAAFTEHPFGGSNVAPSPAR